MASEQHLRLNGPGTSRRSFIRLAGWTGAAVAAAACSPAAAPSSPSGGAPVASSAPAAGGAREAWQDQWDQLVAAAKKEGKISVIGNPGADVRAAYDAFEKAFPGITVDLQAFTSSSLAIPKIQQERAANVYTFDVGVYTIQSLLSTLQPDGVFDPLRPALFRPDVLDDKSWRGGYESGWMDNEKKWTYNHMNYVNSSFTANTSLMNPADIKTLNDLTDPKWRGKFYFADVRTGFMFVWMAAAMKNLPDGKDVIKKLLVDQQPKYSRDTRQIVEQVVRGAYAMGTGVTKPVLQEFLDQGLGKNVQDLHIQEVETVSTSGGGLWLFNKAPHPNAAKLFVNWALTKEGQAALSKGQKENSRRADVEPYDASTLPDPKKTYFVVMQQDNIDLQTQARVYGESLVGA